MALLQGYREYSTGRDLDSVTDTSDTEGNYMFDILKFKLITSIKKIMFFVIFIFT